MLALMKSLLLVLALSLPCQTAFAEEPLPKISPESMEKIQRLSLVLSITEFPQSQGVVMKCPALLPYKDLGGGARSGEGFDEEFHEMIALTDTKDPVGYYGVNIYFGDTESEKDHVPLIARMEIFFQPAYPKEFLSTGQMIWKSDRSPRTIESMRALMRALKRTPCEFVQQLDENGVPSEQMQKDLESLSSQKHAPEELSKK